MAYLKAISYYTPSNVVNNEDLQKSLTDVDVEKIAKQVGVVNRSVAVENQTASDLAVEAAKKLFKEYEIPPKDIDFVILCTQSPDYFYPSTAWILQDRLGIPKNSGAFDFDLGCSGFVYGLAIAKGLVHAGVASNILLLTADILSSYLNPTDSNRILFGDAASAAVISETGFAEIGDFVLGSDGSGYENLIIRNGACRHRERTGNVRIDDSGQKCYDDYFYMNGNNIFNFTVDLIPELIKDTVAKNNLSKEDVDYYVFHQANKYMLNTLRKINKIPKEKFFVDLSDTGNTTSSTIPVGLKKAMTNGDLHDQMNVMIAGFGVGLSWGATILKF